MVYGIMDEIIQNMTLVIASYCVQLETYCSEMKNWIRKRNFLNCENDRRGYIFHEIGQNVSNGKKKRKGNLVVLCLVKISSRKVKEGVFINYL